MSTLDNTISMLEALPETDLLEIQKFTRQLFQRHKTETPDDAMGRFLKPMSQEDFIHDVEIAEQEIASGKYRSAEEVFDGLEHRYRL